MSEGRRNKSFPKSTKRDVRNPSKAKNETPTPIQPKILLKGKEKEKPAIASQPKIVIATREITNSQMQPVPSGLGPTSSTIQSRDTQADPSPTTAFQEISSIETSKVEPMTRPVAIIPGSSHQINSSAVKYLMKTNTDFLVVGIVGRQGVGKSTIMNILAPDSISRDTSGTILQEEGTFSTKSKSSKSPAWPRTESVNMFVTNDRLILIDSPPVLCNSYKKDATTSELDDIQTIIVLLSTCHLLIVVQDDYFDLNLMRLLQIAELTKPNPDSISLVGDYFPNVMFVRNKAKRNDFLHDEKTKACQMLKCVFKHSQMKIFIGQMDKHKNKQADHECCVNYFVFPTVGGSEDLSIYPNIDLIAEDLRNRVFSTPRNQMYNGANELNEGTWFDLITNVTMNRSQFFLTAYEEVRRSLTFSSNI